MKTRIKEGILYKRNGARQNFLREFRWLESISNFFPRKFHNIRVEEGERSERTENFPFVTRDILITGNKDDQRKKNRTNLGDSSLTKIDRLPANSTWIGIVFNSAGQLARARACGPSSHFFHRFLI